MQSFSPRLRDEKTLHHNIEPLRETYKFPKLFHPPFGL
ncbi:hypothetical protein POREN0001_0899 [Porphyromonas endodontalis ATCC 35406]|uniref:Uncharacterized protein n=1 Tax=Porphyromonas endodontalis (strain ATCC 35406 / DSM 24491 / JCM 8526 / CCUG 16442 / BCRC 14492 / NCTC 13058 / HG 370) TaxID=553175 RepID=C3J9X7_POREA|nr:hypothetical protein POREN0001_0899 [Porphyromonas endodontalis ATCC 35406]